MVGDCGVILKTQKFRVGQVEVEKSLQRKYWNYFSNRVHQGIVKKCPDALYLYSHGLGMKLTPPSNMKRMRIGKRNCFRFILTGGTNSLWLLSNTVLCSCLRNWWY